MKKSIDYTLYLCTDEEIAPFEKWPLIIEEAIKGGVTLVQLRMKHATTRQFMDCAMAVKKITDRYTIPLIINDRLDVAMAIDAHGLHVGQEDMKVEQVRAIWGTDKLVGVSAHTVKEAIEAVEQGADYLGVGAMFATQTKEEASVVSLDVLRSICERVSCPVVVIGGIKSDNLETFEGQNIDGFAVVSAIMAKEDVYNASKALLNKATEVLSKGELQC